MTPEAQQRAIAIACGKTPSCAPDPYVDTPDFHEWREWRTQENPFPFRFRNCSKCPALHLEGERYVSIPTDYAVPDYLHDLDAMNEAEKVLTEQQLYEYFEQLASVCNLSSLARCIIATAAQRAEAFLKTLGLWVEETESQPCQ